MKITKRKETHIKGKIHYEDPYEVVCSYEIVNGKLKSWKFYNKSLNHLYEIDDLDLFRKTHWSDLYKVFKEKQYKDLEELQKVDLSKLYYVGGGMDGMLRTISGEVISTPCLIDTTFTQVYLGLWKESDCKEIIKNFGHNFISLEIEDIFYMNRFDENRMEYGLKGYYLLSDEKYKEFLSLTKNHFIDAYFHLEAFKFLTSEELYNRLLKAKKERDGY